MNYDYNSIGNIYSSVQTTSALNVLEAFGILKKDPTSSIISTMGQGVNTSGVNPSTLFNLTGNTPITIPTTSFTLKKEQVNHKFVEQSKDALPLDDVSQSQILAKYLLDDGYISIERTFRHLNGQYFIVNHDDTSYRVIIKDENIPHLLGLPNFKTPYSSFITNAISKCKKKYDRYLIEMNNLFTTRNSRLELFQSIYTDLSNELNLNITQKDNLDKIALKKACMTLFLQNIQMGSMNQTHTFYASGKGESKILSAINIPGTDGYVGMIAVYNPTDNAYVLTSIVGLTKKEVSMGPDNLENECWVSAKSSKRAHVEEIDDPETIKTWDSAEDDRRKNEKVPNTKINNVKNLSIYFDKAKAALSNLYHLMINGNISNFSIRWNRIDKDGNEIKISNAQKRKAREKDDDIKDGVFTKINDCIEKGSLSDEFNYLLPKYLIYIMLNSKNEHNEKITNTLITMENMGFDKDRLDVLKNIYKLNINIYDNNLLEEALSSSMDENSEPFNGFNETFNSTKIDEEINGTVNVGFNLSLSSYVYNKGFNISGTQDELREKFDIQSKDLIIDVLTNPDIKLETANDIYNYALFSNSVTKMYLDVYMSIEGMSNTGGKCLIKKGTIKKELAS